MRVRFLLPILGLLLASLLSAATVTNVGTFAGTDNCSITGSIGGSCSSSQETDAFAQGASSASLSVLSNGFTSQFSAETNYLAPIAFAGGTIQGTMTTEVAPLSGYFVAVLQDIGTCGSDDQFFNCGSWGFTVGDQFIPFYTHGPAPETVTISGFATEGESPFDLSLNFNFTLYQRGSSGGGTGSVWIQSITFLDPPENSTVTPEPVTWPLILLIATAGVWIGLRRRAVR